MLTALLNNNTIHITDNYIIFIDKCQYKKEPLGPFLKLNILKNITTDKPRNSAYLSIARIAEQR